LARSHFEEAIERFSEAGMPNQMMLYRSLGALEMYEGNYELARHYTQISINLSNQQSAIWVASWATLTMGYIFLREGDLKAAREIFTKSHQSFKERTIKSGVVHSLEGMALLLLKEHQAEKACKLLAWANATRAQIKELHFVPEQEYFNKKWDKICTMLDPITLASARAAGESMSADEAARLAFEC
jgi:tetratricopeptide (TPR) repeat protein